MDSESKDSKKPAKQADSSALPFAELAKTLRLLRQRTQYGAVYSAVLEDLLRVATSLETAHTWAAEMQLGAEGFDNTTSARAYGEIQGHLINAARDIGKACEILHQLSTY